MLVKEFAPPPFLLSNYLGGLDTKVTEGDLYSAFVPFGEIVAVYLPKNNLSKIVFFKCCKLWFFSWEAPRLRIRGI